MKGTPDQVEKCCGEVSRQNVSSGSNARCSLRPTRQLSGGVRISRHRVLHVGFNKQAMETITWPPKKIVETSITPTYSIA